MLFRSKSENKERKAVLGIGAAIEVAKEAVEEKGVEVGERVGTAIPMRVMIPMLAIE